MTKTNKRRVFSWDFIKMPPKYDRGLFYVMAAIYIFGTIMLLSISAKDASSDTLSIYRTLVRQIGFFIVGIVAMLFLAKNFTIKRARFLAMPAVICCIILLIMCLFQPDDLGIAAWITIPTPFITVTIQPSEFTKLAFIVFFAVFWGELPMRIKLTPSEVFVKPLLLFGIASFIILKYQNDFGSFAISAFLVGILALMPAHPVFRKFKITLKLSIVVIAVICGFLCFSPLGLRILESVLGNDNYMYQRFAMARNPFVDVLIHGYQFVNALVAFNKGGLFGVGLGNSTSKFGYFLPATSTDSVLAIIVEELGFVGFLFICVCYIIIIYKLFNYALKTNNLTAKMILVGIGSYFFIHFALNVGGVTALIPMTGVPLIFLSTGGSSSLTAMMGLGIAQAIISSYRSEEIE